MKKFTWIIIFCLISFTSFSQSIYIKPIVGYGVGMQGQFNNLGSSYYYENNDSSYTRYGYEAVKYSFGKGAKFGLAVGTTVKGNVSFELAAEYSKGKSPEMITYENGKFDYGEIYTLEYTDKYNFECKSIQIFPAFLIKSRYKKLSPYLKLGAVISLARVTENYERSLYNSIPSFYPFENWTYVLENKRTLSFGYTAAIGSEIYIIDGINFFAEARLTSLYTIPKSGEITLYKYRGEDKLETLPDNRRKFEYVEAYNDNENTNADVPGKRLIQRYSLSNIAVMAGFKIDFNLGKTVKSK